MNDDQLDAALEVFCRRRPFRTIMIEFISGAQLEIRHPASGSGAPPGIFYVIRSPDRGFTVFAAETVACLLDVPKPGAVA